MRDWPLLWAYLDSCLQDQSWDAVGKLHLEVAARAAERLPSFGSGMFSGLSGLAFAGWQLSREGTRYRRLLASLDDDVAGEAIQIATRVRESNGLSVSDFDLISGLSGTGAYLLCRHKEASVAVALANTVEALVSLVTSDQSPPPWHTPARFLFDEATRQTYPNGNLNGGFGSRSSRESSPSCLLLA